MMTDSIRVGIDIGGTKMLMLATDSAGVRVRQQLYTGKQFSGNAAEIAIAEFVRALAIPCQQLGIAVPGLVDERGVTVGCDVLPQLVGWNPVSTLQSICPVTVLNDAAAALIGTVADLQPQTVAIVVMVGTGIGAAIYANGGLLRGANGWAGELGSMPIAPDGTTLDALASGAAILAQLGLDADRVQQAIAAGDPTVRQTIDRAGAALGLGLATAINLFNPELIVLSGGTLRWQGYREAALQTAQKFALPQLWNACHLRSSPAGDDLVALGAAQAQA